MFGSAIVDDKPDQHFFALNESTIKRPNRTMVADVYIKNELFESFRGDGLAFLRLLVRLLIIKVLVGL